MTHIIEFKATFRWRVRLMLLSKGSQEIWGLCLPSIAHSIKSFPFHLLISTAYSISIAYSINLFPFPKKFTISHHQITNSPVHILFQEPKYLFCPLKIKFMIRMITTVVVVMMIMFTVNDEYVKLFVAQPAGGSGGPEGTRRNEHGWPLMVWLLWFSPGNYLYHDCDFCRVAVDGDGTENENDSW